MGQSGDLNKSIYESKSISEEWQRFHRSEWIKILNLFFIVGMIILIPFDYFLFHNFDLYTPWRFLQISVCLTALVVLNEIKKDRIKSEAAYSSLLFVPAALMNILYHYYFSITEDPFSRTVLIGNFLVIFFSTFVVHRFWKEQVLLTSMSILSALIWIQLYPEKTNDYLLIVIANIVSALVAYFLRREFYRSLSERFLNLRSFIPSREARLITVISDANAWNEIFKPETRFSVCLCADWRSYQKLARSTNPESLSKYFEIFYDLVFEELNRVVPEGTFYASWVADELFVIFYDEKNDQVKTMERALQFSKSLASDLFIKIRQNLEIELAYDIGLASGKGFLGLQGPKGMKKTTITSEHAGIAKRLENEAKAVRGNEALNKSSLPILMMDENLGRFGLSSGILESSHTQTVEIHHPDLNQLGKAFRYWRNSESSINRVSFVSLK